MTENQNVQVVKNAYAAFARGDVDTIISTTTEDIEWTQPGEGFLPSAGTYRGHDGVRRFFQSIADNYDIQNFEPREFIAQGDHVIVLGHYRSTEKKSGHTAESDWAMSFLFRNGKVARFREYLDTAAMTVPGALGARAA